ncbi:MAG TPA: immunoglobulin domain-containing protein, partial [Candidatus Hydrogenedentes bacterium]|nr:immunoglobulin domain-containing protein [Candidatus Hydrogenedentota bacterium]
SSRKPFFFLAVFVILAAGTAWAVTITPLADFPAPAPGAYVVTGAALGDGRYLIWDGDAVYIESATGTGGFAPVADGYAGDPGFAAVAEDGHTAVLGGGFNGNLYLFDADQPEDFAPESIVANRPHFTGAFLTDTLVIVDAAKPDFSGSELAIVDLAAKGGSAVAVVTKSARYALPKTVVIEKPPFSYSSAITVDTVRGVVYAMDGNTRELRQFSVSAIIAAYTGSNVLDWETDGALVGQAGMYYTGGVSGITSEGFLVIGGSEGYLLPGGIQFVALVSGDVVALIDPTGNRDFYSVVFNPVAQTLLALVEGAWQGQAYAVDLACVNNPEGCAQPHGGLYRVGDELCLSVPCPVSLGSGFDWRKNGAPLSDGGRVSGVTTRTLRVMALQVADSGTYTCAYEDGAKAQQTFVAQV